jgi:hypothetical protein
MGGTVNLPTRQTMLANLLLVKMASFHRMLNADFWVQRLDDAERALDGKLASTLGKPNLPDPLNPAPTRAELLLWRPEAEAAYQLANKLNRALTSDPKWVRCCPQVVAYSYKIQDRTRQVLGQIDQLILELDIMSAYEKVGPDNDESLATGLGVPGRPRTTPGRRPRKGKARKYQDDTALVIAESKSIQ